MIIAISVVNALSGTKVSFMELVFTNGTIVAAIWILEKIRMLRQKACFRLKISKHYWKNVGNKAKKI